MAGGPVIGSTYPTDLKVLAHASKQLATHMQQPSGKVVSSHIYHSQWAA